MKNSRKMGVLSALVILALGSFGVSQNVWASIEEIEGSKTIKVSLENSKATISAITNGKVELDNTGIVTGGAVWSYLNKESQAIGYGSTVGTYGAAYGYTNSAAKFATAVGAVNTATDCATAVGYNNTSSGDYSTAVGFLNKATELGASALGANNKANGEYSAALGTVNVVSGDYSAGMGINNKVYGQISTAFGYSNTVGATTTEEDGTVTADTTKGKYTHVFGANNTVTANNAIVLGTGVTTVADNSVVIGAGSTSEEANTVSVGAAETTKDVNGEQVKVAEVTRRIVHVADGTADSDAATYGQLMKAYVGSDSITITKDDETNQNVIRVANMAQSTNNTEVTNGQTKASGVGALALGSQAVATGLTSLAVGAGTKALNSGVAVGATSQANGYLASAIGIDSFAYSQMTVAVGYNNKAGDSKGAGGTYAVAMGVENKAFGAYSAALGTGNKTAGLACASAIGSKNESTAIYSSAVGYGNVASGNGASALGANNLAGGLRAAAVGTSNYAYGENSAAFGYKNVVGELTLNDESKEIINPLMGNNTYTFGANNDVSANKAVVVGIGNVIGDTTEDGAEVGKETNTVVLGMNNNFSANNALVFGTGITTVADNSIVIGAGSTSEEANTVSVGAEAVKEDGIETTPELTRRIVHVADGKWLTDAATYGQLVDAQVVTTTTWKEGDSQATTTKDYVPYEPDENGIVTVNTNAGGTAFKIKVANSVSYTGSDTITIGDKNAISVTNMAMSKVWTGTKAPTATGDYAFAIGGDAKASGNWAIAIGQGAEATWTELSPDSSGDTGATIAIGQRAKASGNGSSVIGAQASAVGEDAVAVGSYAVGEGQDSTAVGTEANASATGAIAIGGQSVASGERAVSVGAQSKALGAQSAAFGNDSQATKDASLALGGKSTASGAASSAVGYWSTAGNTHDTALGVQSVANAGGATALGTWSHAYGVGSTAIGYQSSVNAGATAGMAIGYASVAKTGLANENGDLVATVSFGHENGDSYTTVNAATGEHITGSYSGNLYSRLTNVADGKAIHDAATYGQLVNNTTYELKVGKETTINNNAGGEAFKLKVSLDSGSIVPGNPGYITGGQVYSEVRPANGTYVQQGQTTAANLKALDDQVTTNTSKIADLDTRVTANTKDIGDIQKNIIALDTNYTTLNTKVLNLDTKVDNLDIKVDGLKLDGGEYKFTKGNHSQDIKYANGDKAFKITIEGLGEEATKYVDGNGIVIDEETNEISVKVAENAGLTVDKNGLAVNVAKAGGLQTDENGLSVKLAENGGLTVDENGLAVQKDGKVVSGDTNIVTGGTVYDAILAKTGDTTKLAAAGLGDNLTDGVLAVNDKIGYLSDDLRKVGAGAAALAALHPEDYDPADKWSFAVGYGHYKSANAGALGAFFKPNADTTLSIGGTIGNGDSMMNAGVSFKLGSRSDKTGVYRTDAAVSKELASLRKSNEKLTADNQILKKDNIDQAKRIATLEANNEKMQKQIQQILSKMEMSNRVTKTAK